MTEETEISEIEKLKIKIKSLNKEIRFLKERNNNQYNYISSIEQSIDFYKDKYDDLKKLVPLKYYKIKYKSMCKDGMKRSFEETIEAHSPELSIKELKKNIIHPQCFELLDISVLV